MSRGYRERGGQRQDAKKMGMNRFKAIDADIASNYDNIDDDDDQVDDQSRNRGGNRGGYTGGRGGYQANRLDNRIRQAIRGAAGTSAQKELVSRVRVVRGFTKYGPRFILKALQQFVEDVRPIMPSSTDEGDFIFYLKDQGMAQAVRQCSKRIKHPGTGDRITFIVDNTVAPWAKLKSDEKAAICEAVDKKCENRTLDLSTFGNNPIFTTKDLLMPLTKNNVFLAVVERVEDKWANLTALSLKDNRLKFLDVPAMFVFFLKQLTVLDLSNNHIESEKELEKLRGLRLTAVFFEGNPFVESFSRASDYLSAIHSVFPRVSSLDGQDCQPKSLTDEDKELNEPEPKPGFMIPDVQTTLDQFLREYFKAYDGEDPKESRKALMHAYDGNNSMMTMTVEQFNEEGMKRVQWPNGDNFSQHIRMSHNIKQIEKWERNRQARLFSGAMEITAQLCRMPATRHLMESLVIDIVHYGKVLVFSVSGLLEEAPFKQLPSLIFFSRCFTIRANQDGLAVLSDQLHMSAMSEDRVARFRTLQKKASGNVNGGISAVPPAPAPTPVLSEPSEEQKTQLMAQFTVASGMKPEWSRKCLEESGWDFQAAAQAFSQLKDSIPREAFV